MLVASVVVTAALYAIPHGRMVAYPLLLLSTLAHEVGHGMAAILAGGRFHAFAMWADGSGVATTSVMPTRWARALVAAGGLLGPAVLAAIGFGLARRPKHARWALTVAAIGLAVLLVIVVRSVFAALFVAVLAVALGWLGRKASAEMAQLALVFLAVQLALSVFSRADYLFTPSARTAAGDMPSDVGQMAEALVLPYWFWGGVCGLASVAVLAWGVGRFWRRG